MGNFIKDIFNFVDDTFVQPSKKIFSDYFWPAAQSIMGGQAWQGIQGATKGMVSADRVGADNLMDEFLDEYDDFDLGGIAGTAGNAIADTAGSGGFDLSLSGILDAGGKFIEDVPKIINSVISPSSSQEFNTILGDVLGKGGKLFGSATKAFTAYVQIEQALQQLDRLKNPQEYARLQGLMERAYQEALYPDTNDWERLGVTPVMAGLSGAGMASLAQLGSARIGADPQHRQQDREDKKLKKLLKKLDRENQMLLIQIIRNLYQGKLDRVRAEKAKEIVDFEVTPKTLSHAAQKYFRMMFEMLNEDGEFDNKKWEGIRIRLEQAGVIRPPDTDSGMVQPSGMGNYDNPVINLGEVSKPAQ